MYDVNVQQIPQCVASCVTNDLPISPPFSPTNFYRDAISTLLSTALCHSRLHAQNLVFEFANQESVKVYSTHTLIVKNSYDRWVYVCSSRDGIKYLIYS